MKKLISALLAAAILLAFFSCAKDPIPETTPTADDVSLLSAEALYEKAAAKLKNAAGTSFKTTVTFEDREGIVVLTATRKIDAEKFAFSRITGDGSESQEALYYDGNTATILSTRGAFCAKATSFGFQAYAKKTDFPIGQLDLAGFDRVEKDGMTVSYAAAPEEIKALFLPLFDGSDGITVTEVSGAAQISEDYRIERETITVTAETAGETLLAVIETVLTGFGEDVQPETVPANAGNILEVGDISLPATLSFAREKLEALTCFGVSEVMDEDLTVGDVSSYRSWNGSISYQAVTDGAPTYYYSQTTRHLLPGMTEAQATVWEERFADGVYESISYNAESGAISQNSRSEGSASAAQARVKDLFLRYLFSLEDLETLSLAENGNDRNIAFTLRAEAAEKAVEELTQAFTGSALPLDIQSACGSISVNDDGVLATYLLEITAKKDSVSYRARYSFTLDETQPIAIPSLSDPGV